MRQALMIVGVAAKGQRPIFCYAQIRPYRGNDRYPAPNLPKNTTSHDTTHLPSRQGSFSVLFWEHALTETEVAQFIDLSAGYLTVPENCPIGPSSMLEGPPFPKVFLNEEMAKPWPVEGAGVASLEGFVLEDGATPVIRYLQDAAGKPEIGLEIDELLSIIDGQLGYQGYFIETRRIGVIERLTRHRPDARTPLVIVSTTKPDVRGDDPCCEIILTRSPDCLAGDLQVHLQVQAWDNIILNRLLTFPATQTELRADAGSHLTDVTLWVFGADSGELLDQVQVAYVQAIDLGISAAGRHDLLPPPFKSAPASPDLTSRSRQTSLSFSIGREKDRAPGFTQIARTAKALNAFSVPDSWKAESRFFPMGPDSQLAVIRWIKAKIEQVGTREAFLIDPYLGSQAFERVILRHGNEDVTLSVIISPARIDPDADALDIPQGKGDHAAKLVATAERLTHQLCGKITIIQIERGQGSRQAFHDRYLGLVGQDGVPQVYLLSNSLSKAAGDWPFTIAEVDRSTAWEVAAYVRGLTQSANAVQDLTATILWQSSNTTSGKIDNDVSTPVAPDPFADCLMGAYLKLFRRHQGDHVYCHVDPMVVAADLAQQFPPGVPQASLAAALVSGMHGRLHLAVTLSRAFAADPNHLALSHEINLIIRKDTIAALVPQNGQSLGLVPDISVLVQVGITIANDPKGSYFVRDQMNSALDTYLCRIELGRNHEASLWALRAGLGLVTIGLEAALKGGTMLPKHRAGIAVDYIYLLARLLRCDATAKLYCRANDQHTVGGDLPAAAFQRAVQLADKLGDSVTQALALLRDDPLIPLHLR